jgi:hypothetical protein
MRRILNSKITFNNPYVIRTELEDLNLGVKKGLNFFNTLRRAKTIYTGATWAYSNPDYETIRQHRELSQAAPYWPAAAHYFSAKSVLTSYWAFKDEQDALQFHLTFGSHASRVHMWDSRLVFTVIEQDE